MSEKLVRSIMVLLEVPLYLIVMRIVWQGSNAAGPGLLLVPFQLISLALAGYLVLGHSSRDEYYSRCWCCWYMSGVVLKSF